MSGLFQRTTQSLEGLTDVDITNIQDGQAPIYDATDQVYKNQTVLTPSDLPSGSSGDVIISDGTGLVSTNRLNVDPTDGYISGSYININSSSVNLGTGALTATDAVGIGYYAGFGASNKSVSIGSIAGGSAGESSVSLGYNAKADDANCIVINATGGLLESGAPSSFNIAPVRNINATTLINPFVVQYDELTKEMFKSEDLHIRDITNRNIQNDGTLTNVSTASLYNGQLTVGVGGNKIVAGAGNNNLVVDLTNQKVGIKTATPNTELEVVGEARISNNGTQTLSFYDTTHSHEHGTVETHQSGTGARMEFHVKNTGSSALTSRLNINPTGSIAFANSADYGNIGQVLNSNGNNPPSWTNDLDQMRTTTTFNINCPLQLGGSYGLGTGGQAVLAGNASLTHPSWIDIYDLLYPVGSVKIMYGTFGGFPGQSWVEFGQGRVLVGLNAGDTDFDTIGEEGGFKEIALTEAQMPRHTHDQNAHNHDQNAHGHAQSQTTLRNPGVQGMIVGAFSDGRDVPHIRTNGSTYGTTATNIPTTATNQFTGGTGTAQTASNGQAHNNLQPYVVVRYYRRTS